MLRDRPAELWQVAPPRTAEKRMNRSRNDEVQAVSSQLDAWRRAGESFRHDGHNYFYVEGGDSADPTVLVLHGFPTSSWDWHELWAPLAEDWHLVAADMLGYGFSDKPRHHDYSLFDQTDAQLALLEHLDVERAHLLAHDYGDTVAQEILARELAEELELVVESATLLNGGLDYEAIQQRPLQRILRNRVAGPIVSKLINYPLFARRFASVFGPETQPSDRELENFWSAILYNGGRGVVHEVIQYLGERDAYRDRWVGALRDTDIPLRFVVGPEDPVSGENIAVRFEQVVADPDVVRLPGIGHYPQIEAPARTLDAILEHLEANA